MLHHDNRGSSLNGFAEAAVIFVRKHIKPWCSARVTGPETMSSWVWDSDFPSHSLLTWSLIGATNRLWAL